MASRRADGRGAAWTDDRVARELEAWFAERAFTDWPTYRTFAAAGHKRLHAELSRSGGPARWAPELGVPLVRHPRGGGFTEREIREQLRALLRAERPTRFPSGAWLARHAPPGLAAGVARTGGGARWARDLHMPPPAPRRWTDEMLEAELRRICAGTQRWPTKDEFRGAGATGVLRAVYRGHGSTWWARRLGLPTIGLHTRRRRSDTRAADGERSPGPT